MSDRTKQSNIFPWHVLTAEGFIKEIKPGQKITSVILMNCGNTDCYVWNDARIEPGVSMTIKCDQEAYLSLSRANVYFDTTNVTTPVPKLVVIAERVTPIPEM